MGNFIRIFFGIITLIIGVIMFFAGFEDGVNKVFIPIGVVLAITGFKVLKS